MKYMKGSYSRLVDEEEDNVWEDERRDGDGTLENDMEPLVECQELCSMKLQGAGDVILFQKKVYGILGIQNTSCSIFNSAAYQQFRIELLRCCVTGKFPQEGMVVYPGSGAKVRLDSDAVLHYERLLPCPPAHVGASGAKRRS
jgi:hypothetical protein